MFTADILMRPNYGLSLFSALWIGIYFYNNHYCSPILFVSPNSLHLFRMIAPALFVGGSIMFFGFIQDFRYTYKTAIQTNFQEEPYVPLENVAYEDNTR
jgi:hypothetical protein